MYHLFEKYLPLSFGSLLKIRFPEFCCILFTGGGGGRCGVTGASYLLVDGKWRFLIRYFKILGKIWSGIGIFNTAGNYLEKQREIGTWNHKKRYFDIWTSFKKIFFASNTSQVFGTLWRLLKSQNIIL